MTTNLKGDITKQRILDCAAELFAEKGFTETTIRELAKAADLKNPASLYFHFPTKHAILEHMLEDYTINTDVFQIQDIPEILSKNSTTAGIMACYQTVFPADRFDYYRNVLCVLLQEQLRNPIVREYMSNSIILRSERNTTTVFSALIKLGVIREDTDTDYWKKVISSVIYAFAVRSMLGIGDNSPDFVGKGMANLLEYTYDIMLKKCGTEKVEQGDR